SNWMQADAGGSRQLDHADALNDDFRHALATPATERETGRECRTKLPVEFRSQQNAGAMQPRFDGFGPQTEQISGFLNAHPFDNACDENGAESAGKLINCLFQHRAYLALRHSFLRIAAGRRGRKMNDVRLVTVFAVCFPVDSGFPAAQSAQSLVHG